MVHVTSPTSNSAGRLVGLHALVVTYQRPNELLATLDDVTDQTLRPATLTVVDNSSDDETEDRLAQRGGVELIRTGDNLGPAGGLAVGVERLLVGLADEDWIVFVDDDDPPAHAHVLESLVAVATRADPTVGAVGLAGARYDRRFGLLRRVPDDHLADVVDVDYLGGNQYPCYRVRALRAAGPPDLSLFFGFDDLELGLRIGTAGFRLVVDGEQWIRRRAELGRTGLTPRAAAGIRRRSPGRRYYASRNLIHIARLHGSTAAPIVATIRFGVMAALADIARERSLRCGVPALKGAWHAWRRRLGRSEPL